MANLALSHSDGPNEHSFVERLYTFSQPLLPSPGMAERILSATPTKDQASTEANAFLGYLFHAIEEASNSRIATRITLTRPDYGRGVLAVKFKVRTFDVGWLVELSKIMLRTSQNWSGLVIDSPYPSPHPRG